MNDSQTLKNLTIKIGSGATPRGGDRSYKPSGISLIRSQNVLDFKFSVNGLAFIDETQATDLDNVTVYENDILLNITGDSIARTCLVPKDILPARVNQHVAIIRCNLEIDNKYIYYYLQYLKPYLLKICGVGGTRNALTKEALEKLSITIQEDPEKRAQVLFTLDAKIELNNRINAELEAMAKTLYDYWFVQFDFPDKNGKPYKSSGGKMVYSEELKREIPEGWDSTTVDKILSKEHSTDKIQSSEILQKGSIPVIDQSTDFIAGYTDDVNAIIKVGVPRIIFGDHTRIIKLINFDFARGADGTQVILSNSKRMPQYLFYHTLLKIDLSNYGYARHYKFLKEQRIILPAETIAQVYDNLSKSYFEMVRHNIFENQKLSELRDWLLPMLMNGQVKVS